MSNKEKLDQIMNELEQAEKAAKKKRRELYASCNHKGKSGKLKIEPTDDKDVFRCKRCKQEFSLRKIKKNEAVSAAETINDMIQQIKCFSDSDDDDKLLKELGSLSCSLEMILDLYNKALKSVGKKDKKKNKDKYGNYGFTGMKFLK